MSVPNPGTGAALPVHLVKKVAKVAETWASLRAGEWDPEAAGALLAVIEGLCAESAVAEQPHLASRARGLESYLSALLDAEAPPTEVQFERAATRIDALRDDLASEHAAPALAGTAGRRARAVYLFEPDHDLGIYIAMQLNAFQYSTRLFSDTGGLLQAVEERLPAAVVIDTGESETADACFKTIEMIQTRSGADLPVIVISRVEDLDARLQAVRLGCQAYLTRPIDVTELLDRLNELTDHNKTTAARVMLLSTLPTNAETYRRILESNGFEIDLIQRVPDVSGYLQSTTPAVMLIDVHGENAGRLGFLDQIEADARFTETPIIVFNDARLSDFARVSRRARALAQPVEPQQLLEILREGMRRTAMPEKISYLGKRDLVTGLYNRSHFLSELEVATRTDRDRTSGLLYLVLDNFKYIKETAGLSASDLVVGGVARTLRDRCARSDVIARFGDCVFTVLSYHRDLDGMRQLAETLRRAVEEYVCDVGTNYVTTTCSIGLAMLDETVYGPQEGLSRADVACESARHIGGNRIREAATPRKELAPELQRQDWLRRIREALDRSGFQLVFQPVVNLHGEAAEMYEVLLRLPDGEGGEILPSRFLPAAQTAGLCGPIDRWVIKQTIDKAARQYRQGKPVRFLIKLSEASVQDETLLPWLARCLRTQRVPGELLVLEITENVAVQHLRTVQNLLRALRPVQCRVALDHFGAKPNSLHLLKHLPVQYLKLDESLIRRLGEDPRTQPAFRELVGHAHNSGLFTIAGYVENARMLATLWVCGVSYVQGNFSQPPAPELAFDFQGIA